MRFILAIGICIYQVNADSYEYESSKEEVKNIKQSNGKQSNGGHRLVGARQAKTSQYPFIVGWNLLGSTNGVECTGSLLTARYFLSAAHCNGLIDQKINVERNRQECIKTTETAGHYQKLTLPKAELRCRRLNSGDLEIVTEPKGKAWLGVDDINQIKTDDDSWHMSLIKRHIRHQNTYRGGGTYGHYGGYDITLVELETPQIGYKPACLPSPKFRDIRTSIIAGFGTYRRGNGQTCETNNFGEMKYHYCNKKFGNGSSACNTNQPPPMEKECETFFNDPQTPNTVPAEVEEIRIQTQVQNKNIYCYSKSNPENPNYGWCYTSGNYYKPFKPDEAYQGWGFCGKDCYLDSNTASVGILRAKTNVLVLSEQECDLFLKQSLGRGVEVTPKVICVAKKSKWKDAVWLKTASGYQALNMAGRKEKRYGQDGYIASVGTCKGDSGGPAFVQEGDRFVVTGVVSGGRGILGECGGVNNPIHYVRVKMFTDWIQLNIGEDKKNLCWDF